MTDSDKVLMVYRYFFYNEVYYKNKVSDAERRCRSLHVTSDDYVKLIRAQVEFELFSKIMTDILDLFNPKHF